jgi:hypothetical protein
MRGVPCVRGQRVSAGDQEGVRIEQAPEIEAFQRWTDGEFLRVEREFARLWRNSLSPFDLVEYRNHARALGFRPPKCRDLGEAKDAAAALVNGDGTRYATLKTAMGILGVPEQFQKGVVQRWKMAGGPSISVFVPYCAHVLRVNFFFYFAVESSLESAERFTHPVDLAYVYYLPFCFMFVSNDNFHRRIVPHFLTDNQSFIPGVELKADLARLDSHYMGMPESVRDRGIFDFASQPPTEGDFLTTKLWDRFLSPIWRKNALTPRSRSSGRDEKLLDYLNRIDQAAPAVSSEFVKASDPRFMHITKVPLQRGKWKQFPPEVKAKN